MTKEELIEHLHRGRLRSLGNYCLLCKIEPELEPWFVERANLVIKLGYLRSVFEGHRWESVPKLTELPTVLVGSEDRDITIEIKNWQYKSITMGISDLVDPDIATKMIEHYRDEKTRKIDSLLIELGKETSILEEIEAKIKEFGIEENND